MTGAAASLDRVASVQALIPADQVTTKENRLTAALTAVDSEGNAIGYLDLSQGEASVTVTLLSLKTVPLTVPQTGTLPDGIHLVSLNTPDTVTLRGTASALKTVNAVATAPLDLSGYSASGSVPLEALLPEGIELAKASEGLSATLELSGETVLTFTYTKADLTVAGLGEGLTLRLPDGNITLTVTATTHGAAGLSKGDFTLTLDLTGRTAGTYDVALSADTSADVLDLAIKPAVLTVTLTNE